MKNKYYAIFGIVFLLLSLTGAVYLTFQNADNRNKAEGGRITKCKDLGSPKARQDCANAHGGDMNALIDTPEGPDTPMAGDKCSSGQTSCQQNSSGKNTGYMCKCLTVLDPNDWQCTTPDTNNCPTDSGGVDPNKFSCTELGLKISGRCITGNINVAYKYKCSNQFGMGEGCQKNQTVVRNVSSVCFDNNFCGTQQIDSESGSCFISVEDRDSCNEKNTDTPTPTIRINTPTPTRTPTPTFVITTDTPTPTPTGTLSPTPTPTNTPTPTSTGTVTPTTTIPTITPTTPPGQPTNTPPFIAQGPSPTRIILPNAGFNFPSQALTIIGGIATLLGFLILL